MKTSPDYKGNSKVRNHLHNLCIAFLGIVSTVSNASSHTSALLSCVFKDEPCPLKEKSFSTLSLVISGFHLLYIRNTFHGKQIY